MQLLQLQAPHEEAFTGLTGPWGSWDPLRVLEGSPVPSPQERQHSASALWA